MTAASGFGGFCVRTGSTAGATVIGIGAVNVDTDVLLLSYTKRVFFILARSQDALSIDTILELRTRNITAARCICPAEILACIWIDA